MLIELFKCINLKYIKILHLDLQIMKKEEIKKIVSDDINIHFDVLEHSVSLDVFKQTAFSLEKIAKNLNRSLFNNSLDVIIYISAPKKGSVLEILNLILINYPAEVLITTYLSNLISKRFFNKSITEIVDNLGNKFIDTSIDETNRLNSTKNEISINIEIALLLLKEAILNIFKYNNEELEKYDINGKTTKKIIEAKNDFYKVCIKSENNIKALGFDNTDNFPIKKKEFMSHIVDLDNLSNSIYKLHKVIIVSPVIVDGDNGVWRTKILGNNNSLSFFMDDEDFKNSIFSGTRPIKITNKDDELTVYVEYKTYTDEKGRLKEKRSAIKVYSYNNTEIAPIPKELQFDIPNKKRNPNQFNLFNLD